MSKYEIKGNGEEAVSFTRMWRVTKGVDDAQYTLHLQLHEEAQEHRKPYQRRRPWRQVPSIWWQWCCCCVAVFRFYGACGGFTKNQAKPHLPHDNMLRGKTVCLNCSEIFLVWWALFGLKQWFIASSILQYKLLLKKCVYVDSSEVNNEEKLDTLNSRVLRCETRYAYISSSSCLVVS